MYSKKYNILVKTMKLIYVILIVLNLFVPNISKAEASYSSDWGGGTLTDEDSSVLDDMID